MEELRVNKNPGYLARIEASYSKLKGAEIKIAKFIENNPDQIIHLSITEVAELSKTSESSVVRLCKRLGYKGFQDLKIHLAQEMISPEKQIHEVIEKGDDALTIKKKIFQSNIQALYDSVEVCSDDELLKAIEIISKANNIEFYGTGGSGSVALDAQHKLLKIGVKSVAHTDSVLQAMSATSLNKGDVVIGISHTGSNRDVLHAMKLAQTAGAKLICITNSSKSPITQISDVILHTASRETLFRTDAIASRIAQLTIIDVLIAAIALKDYEQYFSKLQNIKESTIETKL